MILFDQRHLETVVNPTLHRLNLRDPEFPAEEAEAV
jgi:hypothetical protein